MKEEKWESEYLKSLGKKFLDDTFTLQKTQEQLEAEFKESLKNLPKEEAEEIFEKYTRLADLLRFTFGLYYNNVEYFEKLVLQANSIISTSLMLEYRIHDILFNRDLLLENDTNDTYKMLQYFENNLKELKEIKETELKKLKLPLVKELNEKDRALITKQVYSVLQNVEHLYQDTQNYLKDTKKKIEIEKNTIKELQKDEYFIGYLSKEKQFKGLLKSILSVYIANDIIDGVREHYIKKYDVIIANRTPKKDRVHCLNRGAYMITKGKIQDIMRLSLLNHGGNIIDDTTLKLFSLFIDIETETKKQSYKKALKQSVKITIEELETVLNKALVLETFTRTKADKLIEEMGWYSFEEK